MKAVSTLFALATLSGSAFAQALGAFDLGDFKTPYGPAPKGCSAFEILDARGTSEPGDFGAIVGDRLIKAVQAAVPGTRGYAVQYPADASEAGVKLGAADIINRLKTKSVECPDMKYALVGYSQGAAVMRAALQGFTDEAIMKKIEAMVMFGDPGLNLQKSTANSDVDGSFQPFPTSLYRKLREFCAPKDPVCGHGGDFIDHLNYSDPKWMGPATQFIIDAFKGMPQKAKQDGAL